MIDMVEKKNRGMMYNCVHIHSETHSHTMDSLEISQSTRVFGMGRKPGTWTGEHAELLAHRAETNPRGARQVTTKLP